LYFQFRSCGNAPGDTGESGGRGAACMVYTGWCRDGSLTMAGEECLVFKRKMIILVLCCGAAGMDLLAQQPTASEERSAQARERIAQLQSRLNLTPEQVEKLKPILQKEMEEVRALREKQGSDTSRKGKARVMRDVRSIQEKYEGQIDAVLTPEQKQEWKKFQDERKQQLKQKRGK
jgi:Spy/CpxP family protein refolding chaperone